MPSRRKNQALTDSELIVLNLMLQSANERIVNCAMIVSSSKALMGYAMADDLFS
jgi:hypothetical protein